MMSPPGPEKNPSRDTMLQTMILRMVVFRMVTPRGGSFEQ